MSPADTSEYQGQGCFLIGSGPSLNRVDVKRLPDFWTISFNRSHIAWEQWGFHPTFYACLDEASTAIRAGEIKDLIAGTQVRRFFLNRAALNSGIEPSERVTLVDHQPGAHFSTGLQVASHYGSVGASSLQLLAGLGFGRVVMLGIDGRYQQLRGQEGGGPFWVEQDLDHFHVGYSRWKRHISEEEMEAMASGWSEVARACRQYGLMEVRIASPGTNLTCFEPIGFEDALSWIGVREPAGDEAASRNLHLERLPGP